MRSIWDDCCSFVAKVLIKTDKSKENLKPCTNTQRSGRILNHIWTSDKYKRNPVKATFQ